jgi:hypothetical protein
MSMSVFWVVTPCILVGRYQRFGGTYCLYLQGCFQIFRWRHCASETLVLTRYEVYMPVCSVKEVCLDVEELLAANAIVCTRRGTITQNAVQFGTVTLI